MLAANESVNDEFDRLLDERKRLRTNGPCWLDITLAARLTALRAVAKADAVDRKELHAILRSLVLKVVVDWERDQLVLHWKHGGQSAVKAAMRPQRVVANRRRADRPRFRPGENALPLPIAER